MQNNAIQVIQHVLHLQVKIQQIIKWITCIVFFYGFDPLNLIILFICLYDFSCCLGFGDGEEYPFEQDHGTQTNGAVAEGKI